LWQLKETCDRITATGGKSHIFGDEHAMVLHCMLDYDETGDEIAKEYNDIGLEKEMRK
jgi:hypothetical protein